MLNILIIPILTIIMNCVTVDRIPAGTEYGKTVGQTPGTLAFTENKVKVFLETFEFTSGGNIFNLAKIEVAPVSIGRLNSIRCNNINLVYDFSVTGTKVKKVTLEYLDLGGSENLSINGSPMFKGDITGVPAVIAGVKVKISQTPVRGGKKGKVELSGKITKVTIGGQEFWLDTVCGY
jgi:hypothetical protein